MSHSSIDEFIESSFEDSILEIESIFKNLRKFPLLYFFFLSSNFSRFEENVQSWLKN